MCLNYDECILYYEMCFSVIAVSKVQVYEFTKRNRHTVTQRGFTTTPFLLTERRHCRLASIAKAIKREQSQNITFLAGSLICVLRKEYVFIS